MWQNAITRRMTDWCSIRIAMAALGCVRAGSEPTPAGIACGRERSGIAGPPKVSPSTGWPPRDLGHPDQVRRLMHPQPGDRQCPGVAWRPGESGGIGGLGVVWADSRGGTEGGRRPLPVPAGEGYR